MSNGAFAFYNEYNGTVTVNPYFSEIVAIALINYDNSNTAKANIERYFDWHFNHLNTAETDFNGLDGTIYDYSVSVKNGVVVSETSKNHYDSTDSYSALFVKALADYVKNYNDPSYVQEKEDQVKRVVNVMLANQSVNKYTYAKPDYQIIYLMDNAEVYAGLKAAKYLYETTLSDTEMYATICERVSYYETNFDTQWWKNNHYASILNSDNSEYMSIDFSYDSFYPCATSQMYPIVYGLTSPDSEKAAIIYNNICDAWDWEEMDYVTEGADSFYWGVFAYYGSIMGDTERLNKYLEKYNEIVENGRKYPLYSAEAAMVLMACMEQMQNA